MTPILITETEMQRYEDCRASGMINMFDTKGVEVLTGLSSTKIKYIMQNYVKLMKSFEIIRGG